MDRVQFLQHTRRRLGPIASFLFWLLPSAVVCATPVEAIEPVEIEDLEPEEPNPIDRARDVVSTNVNDVARWLDSFFLDERFVSEEAFTRIRIAPGAFFEEGESPKPKFSLNAKINVPRFNERLKLTISGDTDDRPDESTERSFSTTRTEEDEANIGLEYTLRDKLKINTSISTGVKFGREHIIDTYIGPRLRRTFILDDAQLRFTERIRWYTDIGWESITRLDYERTLPKELFFRGTVSGRWREEDPGYRYEIRPTIFQALRRRAAVEYQWNTLFETRPSHRLEETNLRLRYRQQKWRKWLFFEINPQLAFRNDDDFRPTPGIEFRIEASFGGPEERPGEPPQ
ncbi:MAG: hypothetical protein RQ736_07145 [Thiogranum sp.]|nr:hypothetical protein [Thiogranum sp.]